VKNNILGFILPDDADGNILQHTKQLQKIDLSMNKIPTLPPKFFKHQNSLEELYMNNNIIEDVVFEIIHMKNLSYFDLSNNRLPFLNDDVRKQPETVHISNKNIRVDISGNHLQCTCDTLDFLQWISTTDIVFNNLNKTNCQLKNKTTVSLLNANLLFTTLSIECSSVSMLFERSK
jgi:Leucine-rich repeat (LRR) protein